MYSTGGTTPVSALAGGSSYLCLGPPMAGMDGLLASLLTPDGADEAAIAVLTDSDPDAFLERMANPNGPVAIVDCTGEKQGTGAADDDLRRHVPSPADLTSIGVAVSEFLDAFVGRGLSVRVGIDSLTTLSVYAEREQLFAFLNAIEPRVTGNGGLFLATLFTESVEARVRSTVEPVFDGRIELREGAAGNEVRVLAPGEEPTDWEAFESEPRRDRTTADARRPEAELTIDSLSELIRRVDDQRLTLSVYNGSDTDIGTLRTRMDRLNVTVETVETPLVPDDVAMLHRDEEFLVAEPLGTLLSSLSLDELQTNEPGLSPIIEYVDGSISGVSGVGKPVLVNASRMFELLAYRTGQGTLHAGFQELSRFAADDHVTRLYDGIVGTGVDVTIYGVPDTPVERDGLRVVADDGEEIADSWFVVFEGPETSGALVCEEREPGVYYGFWTYRPELVSQAAAYLEATY